MRIRNPNSNGTVGTMTAHRVCTKINEAILNGEET